MYSPQLGRFLSQDPLVAGQPDVLFDNDVFGDRLTMMRNLYGYANNNPVNVTDPSGLFPAACVAACAGVAACFGPGLYVCWRDTDTADEFSECLRYYASQLPWWHRAVCGGAVVACGLCVARIRPTVCPPPVRPPAPPRPPGPRIPPTNGRPPRIPPRIPPGGGRRPPRIPPTNGRPHAFWV
jgi:RHS repeat-associated protein